MVCAVTHARLLTNRFSFFHSESFMVLIPTLSLLCCVLLCVCVFFLINSTVSCVVCLLRFGCYCCCTHNTKLYSKHIFECHRIATECCTQLKQIKQIVKIDFKKPTPSQKLNIKTKPKVQIKVFFLRIKSAPRK